jgi:hypothetical protein
MKCDVGYSGVSVSSYSELAVDADNQCSKDTCT